MARIRLQIEGRLGQISVNSFVSIIQDSLWILHDLDQRISRQSQGTLQWVISGLGEKCTYVDIDTRVKKGDEDISNKVIGGFVDGFVQIQEKVTTPVLFSPDTMRRANNIVRSFGRNGVDGVTFVAKEEKKEVELTIESEKPLQQLVGVRYKTIGSVEGMIELISIHKRYRKFNVYHAVSGKAIKCSFPEELEKDVFTAAEQRRRVIISGLISYNIRGEPISLIVKRPMRFLKKEEELPTIEDMLGLAPDITGNLSTEQFIRSLREE